MDRFIQITFFLSLFLVIHCAEDFSRDTNHQAYDIGGLFTRTFLNIRSLGSGERKLRVSLTGRHETFLREAAEKLQNSSKCSRDISYIAENLKERWALQMLDSYGKPESGFLIGNTKWLGEYNECINVYAPPKNLSVGNFHAPPKNLSVGNFHGQYCSLALTFSPNISLSLTLGICLPDTCSSSQFQIEALQLLNPVDVPDLGETEFSPRLLLSCQARERHLNAPAKAVVALLSVFCILAILGSSVTAVKYFMKKPKDNGTPFITNNDLGADQQKSSVDEDLLLRDDGDASNGKLMGVLKALEPFLECFCVFKNGAKLLNTSTGEGELLCIHGIRFLSMSWVILGHAYMFGFAEIRNLVDVLDLVKNFPFQIVLQGFYSVDSFFVLSGFLLTYLCMQELSKKKGGINWPYFYIHRYLRLTPVYMIVLGFSATVYLYLGSGPFWPQNDIDINCKNNWWRNLLYINNFSSQAEQCMGWSWYLANDMQFFVISPIILITLWRWPKIGFSILAAFWCACFVSNFYLTYHYDMLTGIAGLLSKPSANTLAITARFGDFFDKIYVKPYTRIGPYLAGMLTGYILFLKKRSDGPKHSWITLCVGWIVATTITLACVYGLYHQNPGLVGRSFYNALSRTTFAVGLCWVIYTCLIDQGGVVNSILSYKFMIPLSRLTYSAYLIHPLILSGYFGSLGTSFQFSHPSVVILYLGLMVVTYALSLPVALVFESPVISLEKLIRKSFSKQ